MANGPIPTRDSAFLSWLNNFQLKLGGYAATFGIDAAEVTQIKADYTLLNYLMNQIDVLSGDQAERIAYKNLIVKGDVGAPSQDYPTSPTFGAVPPTVPPGIRARCASIVQRIKKHTAFSEATGADLQIFAADSTFDPATYKAKITGARVTGPVEVTIEFAKASGNIDGVNVYVRLQGQTAWRKLGLDTMSPYVDTTPLTVPGSPEIREYRVRGVIADHEIGLFSDVAIVTVS